MTVIVFEIVSQVLQSVERFILNFPSSATSFHKRKYIVLVDVNICNPREGRLLPLGVGLPVLQRIDANIFE